MTTRQAELSDAPAIAAIYAHYVEDTSASFELDAPTAGEYRERMKEIQEFFPFHVCEDDGGVIGFAYAHAYHPRKAYQWICETSIYIKEGQGRQGAGIALYSALLPELKKQGFVQAMAIIACPNEASEAFHEKMGFELLATFPKMGYKFGEWHDVKYYKLDLNKAGDEVKDPVAFKYLI
ncbi:MAG: GNAT family N-acetyltransferase [Clostridiales bacterium]|jgi:phosphinothricin acetyltransferase|nr:GNAT family N-acetyltransferase [Clostridiales bacterium]